MKLKSLKLKNFRRFYGEQEIVFSTSDKKKITLIHAENGVGKTNILRAVHWVMYGELIAIKKKDKAGIVNSTHKINVKNKKESFDCHVILHIEDQGQSYELKRTLDRDGKKDSFKIWYGKDEKSVSAAERNLTIERILPKGLAKYFFFQGESLETMTDSGTDVGAAISNIQGIDDAKDVLEQLKKNHLLLEQKFGKKTKLDADARDIKAKIDKLRESVTRRDEALVGHKKDRDKANSMVKDCYELLKKSGTEVLKIKIKENEEKTKLLEIKKRDFDRHQLTKNKSIQDFYSGVMTGNVAGIARDIKDDLQLAGKFPHKLSRDLITQIFKDKKCICSRCVEVGSDEWKAIEEWNKEAGDPRLTDRFSQVGNISQDTLPQSKKFQESLENHEALSNGFEADIKNLKDDLKELKEFLADKDPEKAALYEKMVTDNEKNRDRANEQIELLTASKELELKELSPLERQYENIINKSQIPESEKNAIRFLKRARERMKNIIESQQGEAESFIKEDLQNLISRHANKSFKLEFDDDFVPSLKEKNIGDSWTAADASMGETLLLNIAFVTSMIEYSKHRKDLSKEDKFSIHGLEAPLLLDAPFGDAQTYKQNIADILVNSPAEQVIIMCAKGFYQGSFEEKVIDQIGSRYIVENHATPSEIKKEFKDGEDNNKININGKNHVQFFVKENYGFSKLKKVNG